MAAGGGGLQAILAVLEKALGDNWDEATAKVRARCSPFMGEATAKVCARCSPFVGEATAKVCGRCSRQRCDGTAGRI